MADLFNPYREWLGIETARGETPDHYRLLGLTPFESDAARIGPAADAAMARIRRIRPGVHLADWSLLLDQLGEAKSCLLDKATRAVYDAQLAKPASAAVPQAENPGASPFFGERLALFKGDSPIFAETKIGSVPKNMDPSPSAPAPTASWTGPVITGLLVMVVGMAGLLIHALYQRGGLASVPSPLRSGGEIAASPRPSGPDIAPAPMQKKLDSPKKMDATAGLSSSGAPSPNGSRAIINLRSEGNGTAVDVQSEGEGNVVTVHEEGGGTVVRVRPKEDPKEAPAAAEDSKTSSEPEQTSPTVDAKKTALFAKAADSARTAMAARDLAAAKKHLKTAVANAQTPQDADQTKRLETMLGYLDQFWNGVRASMAKLQPLEEIAVADTRIVVIESANDYLSIKAEGRVERYRATTLPTVLIAEIVRQSFGKDAGSKAVIGTFMAVDPAGDRALARRYWQEAARAGFDADSLLPELDSAAFAKKTASKKTNTKTNAANRQRTRTPTRPRS